MLKQDITILRLQEMFAEVGVMLNLLGMDRRLMPQPIFEDETKGHRLSSHAHPAYSNHLKPYLLGQLGSCTNSFYIFCVVKLKRSCRKMLSLTLQMFIGVLAWFKNSRFWATQAKRGQPQFS